MKRTLCVVTLAIALAPSLLRSQSHSSMPPNMTHQEHLAQLQREAEIKQRGAAAMGFDQDAVAHHFLLTRDGGTIRVEAKQPSDDAARDAIRGHLRQIASEFAAGDFKAPFATHAEAPDGVGIMQTFASAIQYAFHQSPAGGEVRLVTRDNQALAAVHEFLRYQIREHHTGDPLDVPR
jgi:hypothetical protein